MKVTTFREIAARYAEVMGRREGVYVVFGGTKAKTTGRTIFIPTLPAGTLMTPWQGKVFGGYLDHETAHVRWTNINDAHLSVGDRIKEPTRTFLTNLIEDIRIENIMIDQYPGARPYLDALATEINQRAEKQWQEDEDNGKERGPLKRILTMVYRELYENVRGAPTLTNAELLRDYENLVPIADFIQQEFPKVKSTRGSYRMSVRLTEEIQKLFEESPQQGPGEQGEQLDGEQGKQTQGSGAGDQEGEEQEPQEAPEGGNQDGGEGSQDGDSQEGDEDGDSQEGDEDNDAQEGGSPGSSGRDDPSEGQEHGEGAGQDFPTGSGSINQQEVKELLQQVDASSFFEELKKGLEELNKELEEEGQEMAPHSHHPDGVIRGGHENYGGEVFPPADLRNDHVRPATYKNMDGFYQARAEVSSAILAAKKALNIMLRAQEKTAWSRGLEEGILDETVLYQLVGTGSKRVMKEARNRTRVNTAVSLLIDCSSSMDEDITRAAAIMMAEALAGVRGVSLEIAGFTTNDRNAQSRPGVGRLTGMDYLVYKAFDESYRTAKAKLGGLRCSGYTPLGDAYGLAFERLVLRDEPRKILWTITDGTPQFAKAEYNHSDFLLMQRLYYKARKARMESVCLFIGSRAANVRKLKGCFDWITTCESVAGMHQTVLKLTKGLVTGT